MVARAIVLGLLPRQTIPTELLDALQPFLESYERDLAMAQQER